MDLRKVKKLIELVEESGIAELEVTSGDESVRIAMARGATVATTAVAPAATVVAPAASGAATPAAPGAPDREGWALPAPMAGTFYRSPDPDSEPYVTPGRPVRAGDVLCIIESMKMMHEIIADRPGTIEEVCIENGQPVGTGETLFRFS